MSISPAKVRLAQLYALRAQLDALIVAEEAHAEEVPAECPHPPESRRDASTMGGGRKFKCLACGQTIEGEL